jgi:hypothetical protein
MAQPDGTQQLSNRRQSAVIQRTLQIVGTIRASLDQLSVAIAHQLTDRFQFWRNNANFQMVMPIHETSEIEDNYQTERTCKSAPIRTGNRRRSMGWNLEQGAKNRRIALVDYNKRFLL